MPHIFHKTKQAASSSLLEVHKPETSEDTEDMAIITTHYNPCNYNLPRRNYWRWRHHLRDLEKQLVTVEISFDGHFMIHDAIKIEAEEKNILWQKEAAINVALKSLPEHIKYVAWLDSDMLFENKEWAVQSIDMLKNGHSAVQLFQFVKYLDVRGKYIWSKIGALWGISNCGNISGCPGGAWIANRDYLDRIGGLTPYMITGGGDVPAANGLADVPATFYNDVVSKELTEIEADWIEKAKTLREGKPGFLNGSVQHLFHGTRKNRQYVARGKMLMDFNPFEDVVIGEQGILEWTGNNPQLEEEIKQYFMNRREDEEV